MCPRLNRSSGCPRMFLFLSSEASSLFCVCVRDMHQPVVFTLRSLCRNSQGRAFPLKCPRLLAPMNGQSIFVRLHCPRSIAPRWFHDCICPLGDVHHSHDQIPSDLTLIHHSSITYSYAHPYPNTSQCNLFTSRFYIPLIPTNTPLRRPSNI
jgi:hypothetical protein